MRFLVVYQDFSRLAQELIDRLNVDDVKILLVGKGEREASADLRKELAKHPNAPTAVCQVIRSFRTSLEGTLDIQYVAKKFRIDDQQLAIWLLPEDVATETIIAPSEALAAAARRAEHLVIAEGGLRHADEIAVHRWKFANLAASLLARFADGVNLGPLRNWKQDHGVEFATNGRVRYVYSISTNGVNVEGSTEWHLKEGDNTTREGAARIYFDRVEIGDIVKICILYAGPHPHDGKHRVRIDCGE